MQTLRLSWTAITRLVDKLSIEIMRHMRHYFKEDEIPKQIYVYGLPRGGIPVACLLRAAMLHRFGIQVLLCETWENLNTSVFIVDDIIDTGRTRAMFDGYPFFALIDKLNPSCPYKNDWIVFPWETMTGEVGLEENVIRFLEYIGEDPLREGLKDTPKRVIKSFEKLYGGYDQDPKSMLKIFTDGSCNEMVILKNIEFYSTCEHHMLPFYGKAHIAYIPDGRVIGISKLARLLEIYARRLQIQERLGEQVTQALMKHLKPKGAACVLEAQHFCMTSRGVEKQNSIMITSSLKGSFLEQSETRNEFLNMIRD